MVAGRAVSDGTVNMHRRRVRPQWRSARSLGSMRVRNWRVRYKLAAVLLIPSLAFIALAGAHMSTLVSRTTALDEFSRQVAIGREITNLLHEMQLERDRTVGELAAWDSVQQSFRDPVRLSDVLRPQHQSVDEAVDRLREAALTVENIPAGDLPAARALLAKRLAGLTALRADVLDGTVDRLSVYGRYSSLIDELLDLLVTPTTGIDDPVLGPAVRGYLELSRAKELSSQLRARVFAVGRSGGFGPGEYMEIVNLRAQQISAIARFRDTAVPSQVDQFDQLVRGDDVQTSSWVLQALIDTAGRGAPGIDPQRWWVASTAELDLIRQVELTLQEDTISQAATRSDDQRTQTLLASGAILVVLLVVLLTSVVIGRQMARSLRQLRGQALQVAQYELPDALERLRAPGRGMPEIEVAAPTVRSTDEIGDVAEAFRAVHHSAVTLAVEQATMRRTVNAMFVNLARRSQLLVERQLELLDDLEREESDPERLGQLFKLDHLAARMRRNDENLLVLAGSESTRRWSGSVDLPAVVLAAIAEIEHYPRVRHEVSDQIHVLGHCVGDLVHLLAELLENATSFSAPDTMVRVTGKPAPGGGGATIEIIDDGIGMTEAALAEANELVASPQQVDVAASERMGLFVVGHLAARHGVRVELRGGASGVLAVVRIPSGLLAARPAVRQRSGHAQVDQPVLAGAGARGGGSDGPVGQWPPRRVTIDWTDYTGRELPEPREPIALPGPRPAPAPAEPVNGAEPAADQDTRWFRRDVGAGAAPGRLLSGPPAVPVTGGTSPGGLPIRVPMAQLPAYTGGGTAGGGGAAVRAEPSVGGDCAVPVDDDGDGDARSAGAKLSRFLGGVRRGYTEDGPTPEESPGPPHEKEHP